MTSGPAMPSALVLGALWGFIEVAFVFCTGTAPARDALPIVIAPMVVLVLYHAAALLLLRVRPHVLFELALTASILLPPALFFLRGRGQRAPMNLLAGLIPVGLGLVVVLLARRRPSERGWLTPGRLITIQVLWVAAALVFARRAGSRTIDADMLSNASLWCLAMAIVAALIAAASKRRTAASLLAAICAGTLLLAVRLGSVPPSYKGTPVRNSTAPRPEGAPNILLIVLDTVRADHLDLYGYPRPTFALAGTYLREGLVFDKATSSGTFSLPSHGSLFTGLLPSRHGARPMPGGGSAYGRLRPEVETLASFLGGRGYRSAGVSANDVFLAEWTGLQRGFDVFFSKPVRALRFTPLANVIRRVPNRGRDSRDVDRTWSAAHVTNAAIDLASQGDEPFFLFLNYFDAHEPRAARGAPSWFDAATAAPVDIYDTRIAHIDAEVARLFEALEQRGQLDRTLVIVTSDHGEYFGERKLRGHPPVVYEPGTRVPLILRLPGRLAPGRTDRRTGLHEVFRMVGDVIAGRSLDWLRDPDPSPRILTESWSPSDYGGGARPADRRPSTTVVFSSDLKLIHRLSGASALYDLASDPGEQTNLIDSPEPRIQALKEQMLRRVSERVVNLPSPGRPLPAEALERLRALGYLR